MIIIPLILIQSKVKIALKIKIVSASTLQQYSMIQTLCV